MASSTLTLVLAAFVLSWFGHRIDGYGVSDARSRHLEVSAWLDLRTLARRSFLRRTTTVAAIIIAPPKKMGWAVGEGSERMVFRQMPSAPIGALLPAVQQRLLLEVVRNIASTNEEDVDGSKQRQQQIDSLLLSCDLRSIASLRNQDYEIINQCPPSNVLSGKVVRAAMNIYTASLRYGGGSSRTSNNPADIYTVTDPDWKKAYIRANDGLPSVEMVIAADLDLRDLYRNQVQQKLDDAAAEWYSSSRDMEEFRIILDEAATSFDLWLDRISEHDVKEAIEAAMQGQELNLMKPFAAGFIPPIER